VIFAVAKLRMTPSMIRGFGLCAIPVGHGCLVSRSKILRNRIRIWAQLQLHRRRRANESGNSSWTTIAVTSIDRKMSYLETDRPENVAFYRRFSSKSSGRSLCLVFSILHAEQAKSI
jgi:hypothetical protein